MTGCFIKEAGCLLLFFRVSFSVLFSFFRARQKTVKLTLYKTAAAGRKYYILTTECIDFQKKRFLLN